MSDITVNITEKRCPKVFEYFSKQNITKEKDKIEIAERLTNLGAEVLSVAQVSTDVQFVKNELEKFVTAVEHNVLQFNDKLNKSVEDILANSLNIDKTGSLMNKTKIFLREELSTFRSGVSETIQQMISNAQKVSTDKLTSLETGIKNAEDKFNPELGSSYLGVMKETLRRLMTDLTNQLDNNNMSGFAYKLEKNIEQYFGANSPILGATQSLLKQQETNIIEEFIKLREEIAKKTGVAAVMEKTAIKGFAFEDDMELLLEDYAAQFGDQVIRTSKQETGSRSKKGDFIYEFENGTRFVIEAKDESVGLKPMLAYMKDALENRDCTFGILCTKTSEQLPKQVGLFNLYEGDKLFCSFDTLLFAIRWARLFMDKVVGESVEGVDKTMVIGAVEGIRNILKEFTAMKSKLTTMRKAVVDTANDISNRFEAVKESIEGGLTIIEQEIND